MANDLSRVWVESIVRRTLRNMKDSPERSIRNLIDMALNFSEGRFQRTFFEIAQEMLQNEQSAYYDLIRDLVSTVDLDRMFTFGMDLGYNSCTIGAAKIRDIEEKERYNIPWSMTLEIAGSDFEDKAATYHGVINQGKELGVYTWMLVSAGKPQEFLELIAVHSDCAFVLFCTPEEITSALLDEAGTMENLMFVVRYEDGAEEAFALLRERGLLYSAYVTYGEHDAVQLANGELLSTVEVLHPAFTIFFPRELQSQETRREMYQEIVSARKAQSYRTIPVDFFTDNRQIDEVISDDACGVGFSKAGRMYAFGAESVPVETGLNLFEQPLQELLKKAFPKHVSA